MKVNMHEAKSQLSRLAELAWQGEEVVICKAGKPWLHLVPYRERMEERKPAGLEGQTSAHLRIGEEWRRRPGDRSRPSATPSPKTRYDEIHDDHRIRDGRPAPPGAPARLPPVRPPAVPGALERRSLPVAHRPHLMRSPSHTLSRDRP